MTASVCLGGYVLPAAPCCTPMSGPRGGIIKTDDQKLTVLWSIDRYHGNRVVSANEIRYKMPQNNAAAGGVMRSNAPVQIVVKLIPLQYFRLLGDWRIHRVEGGYLIIKKTSECSESNAARKDSEAKGGGTESSTNNEQCDTSFCDKDDVSTCDNNIEDEDYTEIENTEDDEYITEAIIGHRFGCHTEGIEYRVKWKGHSCDENTWEPPSSFYEAHLCNSLLVAYNKVHIYDPLKHQEVKK